MLLFHSFLFLSGKKRTFRALLGVNFINILQAAFMLVDPESVKNTVKSSVSIYAFGICAPKSCM